MATGFMAMRNSIAFLCLAVWALAGPTQAMATSTTVMRKELGTPKVRPAAPLPRGARVSGMLLTVVELKSLRLSHRKMLAVPKVMMIACTRP
jgi:hypothetical protein